MNRQPFYHEVTLLFTTAGYLSEEKFRELVLDELNQTYDDLFNFEIDGWQEGEPGDPADLL